MDLPQVEQKFRIVVIVGTRPEAIKLFPVILAIQESKFLEAFVINTGQHRDLVQPVFDMAGITPNVDLHTGDSPNTLNQLVAKVLERAESIIEKESAGNEVFPTAAVIVHGDTSTAMAGALTAVQEKRPVLHVEAGLRTGNTLSPFPEELNRQIISRIAAFHFAPTVTNLNNLVKERIPADRIYVTGNTGIDALMWAAQQLPSYSDPLVAEAVNSDSEIIVVTAHRRENWDGGLARIAQAVRDVAEAKPEVLVVFPLHPNPKVREQVEPLLLDVPNVILTEPMEYAEFAHLLKRAKIAITDSGGIQEEAPSLNTPVLVTRDETERQEGVEAGTLILVGTDTDRIRDVALKLLEDDVAYAEMANKDNPYGDGFAARRIVAAIETVVFGESAPTPFGPSFSRMAVLEASGFEDAERSQYEVERLAIGDDQNIRYVGPDRRHNR